MGYGQTLSLPHSFSQQIKVREQKKVRSPLVRSPHAFHRTPLSPSFFSLSPLFLPFVFRGSCCNSADHQQLPFQRHLTLPNPRPSLHPDIANVPPTPPPPLPCHTERLAKPKPSSFASSATCSQSYTLSNSSASLLSLCFVAHIVVPVCHHMANGYPQQKERGESEEVSV